VLSVLVQFFISSVSSATTQAPLCREADLVIKQNNTIDLYEEYFVSSASGAKGPEKDTAVEPPSCRTVCVLRDPNPIKRSATGISWHPDDPNKLAVAYSILNFQQMPDKMSLTSHIWDITNPNAPEQDVLPPSPLCCLVYNPRNLVRLCVCV
jgi:dynein intermediate chain 2